NHAYTTEKANRLQSDGTYNYTYDAEGNTLTRTRISGAEPDGSTLRIFGWDYRNRLISLIDSKPNPQSPGTFAQTQLVAFTYDAFNRRIAEQNGTTTS